MIFSWLFFLTVSIPLDRWAPAYTNLNNGRFKYLVGALQEGRILPTDEPAEVYSKNPYLWPIHPYKFTCFFEQAVTLMSTLSDDKYTLILSLLCLLWPHRSIHSRRALYQIPSLATCLNSPPSPSLSTSSPSPNRPSPHQLALHLLNLSLQQ